MLNKNYIKKLFKGDVKLSITYWFFGVFIGTVLSIFATIFEKQAFQLSIIMGMTTFTVLTHCIIWFLILYTIFIIISVWRSADKYQGKQIWAHLARGLMVLWGLQIIFLLYNTYLPQPKNLSLQQEVKLMNQHLPQMIDRETLLHHISINNNQLIFNYKLLNYTKQQLNQVQLKKLENFVKTNSCNNANLRELLNEASNIKFIYFSKNNTLLLKFSMNKEFCEKNTRLFDPK